jgi:hypothetical protein
MTDLEFFKNLTEVERAALLEFSALHACRSDNQTMEGATPSSGFNALFLGLREKLMEHRRGRRQKVSEL